MPEAPDDRGVTRGVAWTIGSTTIHGVSHFTWMPRYVSAAKSMRGPEGLRTNSIPQFCRMEHGGLPASMQAYTFTVTFRIGSWISWGSTFFSTGLFRGGPVPTDIVFFKDDYRDRFLRRERGTSTIQGGLLTERLRAPSLYPVP